jgi:3-oxoacyl-[acyl-carrier-protein] synthase-3
MFLQAPAYVLGEKATSHLGLPGLAGRAREMRMLPDPSLWGWGSVHRTDRPIEELAAAAGRATLEAAALDPSEVDALVLCSTRFPGDADTHGGLVSAVLTPLGLDRAACYGVTLNRCANLLVALRLASALVAGGAHRRVLVATADRIDDEAARITDFALFSDGAAACLISADRLPGPGYRLLGTAQAQDPAALGRSNELSVDLARQVNAELLTPLGLAPADLQQVFPANLYRPVTMLKERQTGFAERQLYTANIERVAHCFAADPLINLVDHAAAGGLGDGGYGLLAVSVPGARAAALLQQLPDDSEPIGGR